MEKNTLKIAIIVHSLLKMGEKNVTITIKLTIAIES